MKIAFLSDLHAGFAMGGLGQVVWDWALQQLRAENPEVVVLGGDLWQSALSAGQGDWLPCLIDTMPEATFYSIPGNRDPEPFTINGCHRNRIKCVTDSLVDSREEFDLLLVNSNLQGKELSAIKELLQEAIKGRYILVMMHHPLGEADLVNLSQICETREVSCLLLAGHEHRHDEQKHGNVLQVTSAGLDPFKTIGGLPEVLIVESGSEALSVRRVAIGSDALWPSLLSGQGRRVVVGIAPYGPLGQLLEVGIESKISAIQALCHMQSPLPTTDELAVLKRWRTTVPETFLSYHMPDPNLSDEAGDMGGLQSHVEWCISAGVQDLTIHLPAVAANLVYDDAGRGDFIDTPLTGRIKKIYKNLARSVLTSMDDCQLSIENHHNTVEHFSGGVADRLSSRPEHIFRMIGWLRAALLKEGMSDSQVRRIGWIFDSGHARNNGAVTNELTLADWIECGEEFLQAAHIHQVHTDAKEYAKNHFRICSIHEALVNHEGLLAAFSRTSGETLRAFVEVRKIDEAVSSYKLLNKLVLKHLKLPALASRHGVV